MRSYGHRLTISSLNIVGFQTWIGQLDIKSSPVYFYVQRYSNFVYSNVAIPFDLERLNVGGGMNLTSGIFTTPRPGTYFFTFSGISGNQDPLYIGLHVNGSNIGTGYSSSFTGTFTLQSTLHLNAGDQVSMQITYGSGILYDGSHYTHFTGWLLQEDLSY